MKFFGDLTFDNIAEAKQLEKRLKKGAKKFPDYETGNAMLKELRQKIKAYEKHVETDTDSEVWKK